jgi:hypothetical protein
LALLAGRLLSEYGRRSGFPGHPCPTAIPPEPARSHDPAPTAGWAREAHWLGALGSSIRVA